LLPISNKEKTVETQHALLQPLLLLDGRKEVTVLQIVAMCGDDEFGRKEAGTES
jgi:hypothetical protein